MPMITGESAVLNKSEWKSAFPRVAPFALFMIFIAIQEGAAYLAPILSPQADGRMTAFLYPARALAVAAALLAMRRHYTEIVWRDLLDARKTAISLAVGILVFVLWIRMDGDWGTVGAVRAFDPAVIPAGWERWSIIFFRITGMAIVVPVMEELFWRSFLARWLVDREFSTVPVGKFDTASFVMTSILFGLEHNMVLAGIMAGFSYNFLLARTRSMACCIVAHAVTNAALCVFILSNGAYHLW